MTCQEAVPLAGYRGGWLTEVIYFDRAKFSAVGRQSSKRGRSQ